MSGAAVSQTTHHVEQAVHPPLLVVRQRWARTAAATSAARQASHPPSHVHEESQSPTGQETGDTSRRRNGRKYIPVDTRYAGLVSLAGISTCSCRAAMHNSVATCSTEGIVPCPATPNNTLRMRARSPARAWCENRSRSRSDMRAPRRGRTFSPRRRASVRISSGKTALATSFVFCIRSATDSPDSRRPSRVS